MADRPLRRRNRPVEPTGTHERDLFDAHEVNVTRARERATQDLKKYITALRDRPVLLPNLDPSATMLDAYRKAAFEDQANSDEPAAKAAGVPWKKPVLGPFPGYQVTYLYPPYLSGTPLSATVVPVPNWYPVSVACASPANGMIDVGAFADRSHGGQDVWGLHFSEAAASLSVLVSPTVLKPSTLTVYGAATISACVQAAACEAGHIAMACLQVFLTVTAGSTSATCGTNVDLGSVKYGDPMPIYYHTLTSKSVDLKQELGLSASGLVLMTLTAKATAVASISKSKTSGGNTFGLVDAEGLSRPDGICKPKGEYYPIAGGLTVPGFAYSLVAK